MYRADIIKQELRGLVGWKTSSNPELKLSDSMTTSESGLYFNSEHPLLTLDNLKSVMPLDMTVTAEDWDQERAYRRGDLTRHEGTYYRAKLDNIYVRPDTGFAAWEVYNAFSAWLEAKTEDSTLRAVQRFMTERMSNSAARSLLDRIPLFDGVGSVSNKVVNTSNTVGLAIEPVRSNGVTIKIERIGLQFAGTGTIKLYVMHTSSVTPIRTIELSMSRDSSMEWFDQKDLFLPYMGSETDAGGRWYICYDQTELPEGLQAINRDVNFSSLCRSCTKLPQMRFSEYLKVLPFIADADTGDFSDDFNDDFYRPALSMWGPETEMFVDDNNFGINLVLSVECDFTEFIVAQKHQFQDLIAKQVAYDLLRTIAYNPNARVNRNEAVFSKAEVLYELDGDSSSDKKSGLGYEIQKVIDSMTLDITGFDKICLPCNRKGIRYKPVY